MTPKETNIVGLGGLAPELRDVGERPLGFQVFDQLADLAIGGVQRIANLKVVPSHWYAVLVEGRSPGKEHGGEGQGAEVFGLGVPENPAPARFL